MFTIYHSNQLDVLKSLVVELIRREPLDNPFEQEQILVQSPGMSQWLKIELAKELGIAANLAFPLPATFIWTLFTQVLDDVPTRSAFNKEAMVWKIITLLPDLLTNDEFIPLQRYLERDDNQLKSYQLAAKIADIFDQYLVFRPEWILKWEMGQTVEELEGEHPWQAMLWQALYQQTISLGHSHYHRANMFDLVLEKLAQGEKINITGMPTRLFVVGITSLPPRYLDVLAALGEHIDVHLMFTNPCRYYWGDIRDRKTIARLNAHHRLKIEWLDGGNSQIIGNSEQLKGSVSDNVLDDTRYLSVGHPLLASWGKLGRDNLYLLSNLDAQEVDAFVELEKDSLLHAIQSEILNLEDNEQNDRLNDSQHKQAIKLDDHSISLHACHSPMREVEVLHDQLLTLFDNDPELKPRHIIVMVADINVYSAAIQAVFGNANGDRYIPFSISDQSSEQENPILLAFMNVMTLSESRCGLSELLSLLEVPAIQARFQLNADQFDIIKRWSEESGIRWGLDQQTADYFELPTTQQNSWLFGIQRMLLGYAMEQEAGLFEQMTSYEQVQGMNAEIAGKLAQFIDQLLHYQRLLRKEQSIEQWKITINQLMDDFFLVDLDGEVVTHHIRDLLQKLNEHINDADFDSELSVAVINHYLKNSLSGGKNSQRFLAGQVNFCTLMPMRSIPFDVVCLLGMSDGSYPRAMPTEGFDLMQNRTKAGDRSRRDDDRYLFLEALQSANKRFYLSYIGRSIQDNTERAPSVLVSELMEYCQQNYCLEGDSQLEQELSAKKLFSHLLSEHSLAPYNPSNFKGELLSYASDWLPTAQLQGQQTATHIAAFQTDALDDKSETTTLELSELHRFWRLPVAYFFNRQLNVFFDKLETELNDDEPFSIDGLMGYNMTSQLLETLLTHESDDGTLSEIKADFYQQQRAQGHLPVGNFGEIAVEKEFKKAQRLMEQIKSLTTEPLEDQEIKLNFHLPQGELALEGWLKACYQTGMLRYRTGKVRSQDILSTWIDHLCLCTTEQANSSHLVTLDSYYHFEVIDADSAKQYLEAIVTLYLSGQTEPLAYLPKVALVGLEVFFDRKGEWQDSDEIRQKALKKMADEFSGTGYGHEGQNDYVARVWREWNEALGIRLLDNATSILANALRHSSKKNSSQEKHD